MSKMLCHIKSIAHLFFGTVATDHPGGQFHGVVLVLIMAHITGVSAAAAGKSEGSQWHKAFKIFYMSFSELPCQTREMR